MDYNVVRRDLVGRLRDARPVARAYISILLIQLSNGLRISEAVEAAFKWAETGRRKLRVRVRKRRDPYERLVVVPRELGRGERLAVAGLRVHGLDTVVSRIKSWTRKALGFNTHALRYAFISQLAERGVSAQLIAKLTGHKKLDYILSYTQKRAAEELLLRLAG